MKRKVIKQGHNTLTITLPSKWAKKQGINAGDEIEFDESDNVLKIIADKNNKDSSIILDITGLSVPLIWRFVSSAYRAGYNEIRIRWEDKDTKVKNFYTAFSYDTIDYLFKNKSAEMTPVETVQALINRFIGVAIVEQRANYCIVKELGEMDEKEFDNALRRIFLIILSMGDECEEAFKGNPADLKAIHMTDTNLDRFADFCLRYLNKKKYNAVKKTSAVFNIIFLLEMIGDEYKKYSIHLLSKKDSIDEKSMEHMQEINRMFRLFYELHYSFKKDKIMEIYKLNKELSEKYHKGASKMPDTEIELYHHCRKISRLINSLVELRIDMEYV